MTARTVTTWPTATDVPLELLHESGPRAVGQCFDWTQTYRVGTGQSRYKVRLTLHVDRVAAQSRIRSEVWLAGQGWGEALTYSGYDFGDRLPNSYGDFDIARDRGEAILSKLVDDVLNFLGTSR